MPVTVSYDDEIQGDYIYRATSGGTVWSSNFKTASAFDYFADNAVVDDALYISSQYGRPFHDIKFYVGTAIVADAITFVWEYKNTAGNWVTLTVTDNTTGFTVLGENWVTFTPPSDWGKYGQTGMPSSLATNNSYCWVRCRISAVTNITEGGAQSTQVVKEKNKSITVSGGTSGTPANFTDIYNADVAAGWNVFTRFGSDNVVFQCNAFIYFSDYFTDTDKFVIFPDGLITCDWGNIMYANANAVVTFGTLVNTVNKEVRGGMIFYFKENVMAYNFINGDSTSTVYMYACAVKSNLFNRCNIGSVNRVWGFFGDRAGFRTIRSGVTDIANAMPLGCNENMSAAPANVDTLIALGGRVAGPLSNSEVFFKNCKVRNYNDFEITSWAATAAQKWHAVNLDALWSEFTMSWGGSPTGGEFYRDYDIYLKVIDKNNAAISGATILITDKDGNTALSCSTNPDGYLNNDFGTAESGTTTTLTDSDKAWTTNQWKGHDLLITSGTGSGQRTTILSNTATVLTVSTLATAPSSDSKYVIIPIITHSKYNYLNGTVPSDTYNDYTLKISKSGYYFRPMKITIDKKIDDVISLERVLDNNFSKRARINTH